MMVCPYDDERLLLILQVDHSKVTGWLRPIGAMTLSRGLLLMPRWSWLLRSTTPAGGTGRSSRRSTTKDCRRTISAASNTSAAKFGWIFTATASIALPSRIPMRAISFLLHSDGLLTQGRGLLPYMPDYAVYPEVKEFLTEQENYRAGPDEATKKFSANIVTLYPRNNYGRTSN